MARGKKKKKNPDLKATIWKRRRSRNDFAPSFIVQLPWAKFLSAPGQVLHLQLSAVSEWRVAVIRCYHHCSCLPAVWSMDVKRRLEFALPAQKPRRWHSSISYKSFSLSSMESRYRCSLKLIKKPERRQADQRKRAGRVEARSRWCQKSTACHVFVIWRKMYHLLCCCGLLPTSVIIFFSSPWVT